MISLLILNKCSFSYLIFHVNELDDPDVIITDQDFRAAIIAMLKVINEKMLILNEQMRNPSREIETVKKKIMQNWKFQNQKFKYLKGG